MWSEEEGYLGILKSWVRGRICRMQVYCNLVSSEEGGMWKYWKSGGIMT